MDKNDLKAIGELLREELKPLKNDIKDMKTNIKDMKIDINDLKIDIKTIKSQQEEDHLILKALEHSAEVNKAEQDKMSNDIAYIKGNIEGLRKDLSTVEIVTATNYADIAKLKAVR